MDGQDSIGDGGTAPRIGGRNAQGYWEITWSERVAAGAWRTRRVSTRTKDRAAADAVLAGFVTTLAKERAEAKAGTIGGLVDAYLAARPHMKSTQAVHLRTVKRHLGHLPPADLDENVLSRYRQVRAVKDGTLRRDLNALSTVLNWAVRKRVLRADDRPHFDLPPEGPPRDLWLREHERDVFWQALLDASPAADAGRLSRVTRFGAIALETAARKASIEGLRWDRVDLGARLIDFRDPRLAATKKRRVPVPISDELFPVIERAWRERTGPFVLDHGGSIRSAWETFVAGCPYPWVTPHVMRHTWATLAARAGVPLAKIAAMLGDTEAVVEKHYRHHAPDYLRDAVNWRKAGGGVAQAPAVGNLLNLED